MFFFFLFLVFCLDLIDNISLFKISKAQRWKVFFHLLLLLDLLCNDFFNKLLDPCIELRSRIDLKVIKVAELLSKSDQQSLLDGIAFINKRVNIHDANSLLLLIFLDHLSYFFEELFKLTAINLFLEKSVKDFVHDIVSIFRWCRRCTSIFFFFDGNFVDISNVFDPLLFIFIVWDRHK